MCPREEGQGTCVAELIDLTDGALDWIRLADLERRTCAYVDYVGRCQPWSGAVFGMSGYDHVPDEPEESLAQLLGQDLSELESLILAGQSRVSAQAAQSRFAVMTGLPPPRVVLLVGCLGSNAVQAVTPEGMAAILCVEHLAPLEGSLGLSTVQSEAWLLHEMAHCSRYEAEGFGGRLAGFSGSAIEFPRWLDALPLIDRIVDEGIASALQCAAHPGIAVHDLLAFSPQEFDTIEAHLEWLLSETVRSASAPLSEHDVAVMRNGALYTGSPQARAIPCRWGYVVGKAIADAGHAAIGGWSGVLAMPAREILIAASEARGGAWRAHLRSLAATCGSDG